MKNRIVTIDGPAGVGKTTLAKRLAEALDIPYLDTGAMFRATALALGDGAPDLPENELVPRLATFHFTLSGRGASSTLLVNGAPIGDEIRTEAVGLLASKLAARPEVRAAQKAAQREIGRQGSLTAEGRDMGTAVFPGADVKFFLDARPEVRARRRAAQLAAMGRPAEYAEILDQIRKRDDQDRNRAAAPLVPADDAVIIDTSDLTVDEVFAAMLARVPS